MKTMFIWTFADYTLKDSSWPKALLTGENINVCWIEWTNGRFSLWTFLWRVMEQKDASLEKVNFSIWKIKTWGLCRPESQELQPGSQSVLDASTHPERISEACTWQLGTCPERHCQGLHAVVCLPPNLSTTAGKMQHWLFPDKKGTSSRQSGQ